ncbi:hypothetical protein E3N88_45671 [Mikania micrantha]|uniref:Nuclear pore complex protein NUP1 n=1 Tax=Mikania micrantha TaxID=192012 RepID=A0A5N6L8S6_9ASTR|nr:hypothetical protein E3N88_45671 [Mikania micrantha]
MATAGDGNGSAPYENSGAGGKFRKKPFRRSTPATPYARPPTAVRNNNPSMLKKLMDPASRLISSGANRLFDVFRKSLPPLSLGPPEINEEPQNVLHTEGGSGNSADIGISELEQMLQQKTFTRSEIQRLTSLLHSRTSESPSDGSLEKHGDKRDNFHAAMSTPVVTSRVVAEEIASPAELAKYYMESRPTSQAPRQDSKLLPRTPMTPVVQKTANSLRNLENGFVTPRSRGRSAMYTMARTPYSRSPSTFSQQVVKSDYGHGAALTSSQGHEGKMVLKRRSSVLDDDIGSGGPLRRIRQKANLLSQRDKKELGYSVFQPLDGAGQNLLLTHEPEPKIPTYASVPTKSTQMADKILQHLDKPSPTEKGSASTLAVIREKSPNKLRLDMLHGQALRSLEKMDSPKFLPSSHVIQKPVVSELTLQSKDLTEENGSRKLSVSHNMSTSVNGDMTDTLKDKSPIVGITDIPSKVTEEPLNKHAFQMCAPEDFFEMDDDEDGHDNGHVLLPLVENDKPKTSAADIIKTPTLLEVSKAPELVEYKKPVFPVASKFPDRVELKEAESDISAPKTDSGFLGGSVSEQGLGFKAPISSPPPLFTTQTCEVSRSTSQLDKIPPVKGSPLSFSADEPSEFKPNASSDPKKLDSTSPFNSVAKNDHANFSVSNNENGNRISNGNDQKLISMLGKSESSSVAVSAATSINGIFSFGTSTKNSSTLNTTPDSNPPIFPSLVPFPVSTSAATTAATTTDVSTTTIPVVSFSTSVSAQAFSFGSVTSTAPTTSVVQTGNTSTSSPFAVTTFATTATTGSAPASQSHGSFFNITNGFQSSTHASSTSSLFGSSAPAFGSSPSFGVGPISDTKSGNSTSGSTTSIFGSTWQQPQNSSGFGSTFTSPSSSTFTFGASSTPIPSFATAGASNSSFGGSSVFGNSTPVFGAISATPPNNNNDQMSMEDSMAEDSMQTHSPVSPFGQAPVSAPGFMFGAATPTPTPSLAPSAVPFSFGGQQNQAPPLQNPFQSSSVEFHAGGGSFSLGSGGEKSNRRIVRVVKNKNRKK